jgi:hypothetical protein
MSHEELENIQLLGLDDTFPFACKSDNGETCGKCCKNRYDLLLTAYDVFRLARHFKCDTGDIIKKYCELYSGADSKLPVVRVIPRAYDESCPFLRKGKCSLHYTDAKPVLCRSFPLAKLNKGNGERGYYYNSVTCGVVGGSSIVRDWIGDAGSNESDAASDAWTDAIFKITPILRKVHKKSPNAYQMMFSSAFSFLYLMYATDDDSLGFAEQCRGNTEVFLKNVTGNYYPPS